MESDSHLSNLEKLQQLVRPHVESFDHFIDSGLDKMLLHIRPVQIIDPAVGTKLRVWFEKAILQSPEKEYNRKRMQIPLLPNECRQAGHTYHGKFMVQVSFQYNDGPPVLETFSFGHLPIMLKSKLCHLRGADTQKLVAHKEESMEMGGYFICGGLERLVRILIMPKRNYPMGVVRSGFKSRHDGFTDKGIIIRCVREDQSSVTLRLYYLLNGSARLGFSIKSREYLLPVGVVLKALKNTSDREIFLALTSSTVSQLAGERAKIILDEVNNLSLFTHQQCLKHIGKHFRAVMDGLETESYSVVGMAVLREFILVHLHKPEDKFNLLIFMLQKLFAIVDQKSLPDNPDTLQNQEVLLPGHLVTIYLKEKLQDWLFKCRQLLTEAIQKAEKNFDFQSCMRYFLLVS